MLVLLARAPAAQHYTLAADPSPQFGVSGQAATFRHNRRVIAAASGYSYTGVAAAFPAESGGFIGEGYDTGAFDAKYVMVAHGANALNGRSFSVGGVIGGWEPSFVQLSPPAFQVAALSHTLVAATGSVALVGKDARFPLGRVFIASSGAYSHTGVPVSEGRHLLLGSNAGAYTFAGTSVVFRGAFRLAAAPSGYAQSGYAAAILRKYQVAANGVAYTRTGRDVGLRATRYLSADEAYYSQDTSLATLTKTKRLNADAGTIVLAPQQAGLVKVGVHKLIANTHAHAQTGYAANIFYGRNAEGVRGIYLMDKPDIGLAKATRSEMAAGAYAHTGVAATLRVPNRLITPEAGSGTLTGMQAALLRVGHHRMAAQGDAYAVTPQTTDVRITAYVLEIEESYPPYDVGGLDVELRVDRILRAAAGAHAQTGVASTLAAGIGVRANAGVYTITGRTADLQRHVIALPVADEIAGSWTDQDGDTTGLYDAIDELIPSDVDYIRSTTLEPAQTDVIEFALTDVAEPLTDSGHVVSYRFAAEEMTMSLTVRLKQGNTIIASWVHSNIAPGDFVSADQSLTDEQAGAITDYTDLRLRFEAAA
jgi:hypothetical protein